jgi:hypothetical protein
LRDLVVAGEHAKGLSGRAAAYQRRVVFPEYHLALEQRQLRHVFEGQQASNRLGERGPGSDPNARVLQRDPASDVLAGCPSERSG